MGLDVCETRSLSGPGFPCSELTVRGASCFDGTVFSKTSISLPQFFCVAAPFGLHQLRFERELAMRNSRRDAYSMDDHRPAAHMVLARHPERDVLRAAPPPSLPPPPSSTPLPSC